jgi:hypothetical protein
VELQARVGVVQKQGVERAGLRGGVEAMQEQDDDRRNVAQTGMMPWEQVGESLKCLLRLAKYLT